MSIHSFTGRSVGRPEQVDGGPSGNTFHRVWHRIKINPTKITGKRVNYIYLGDQNWSLARGEIHNLTFELLKWFIKEVMMSWGLSKWDSNVVFIHLPKLFICMSVFLPLSLLPPISPMCRWGASSSSEKTVAAIIQITWVCERCRGRESEWKRNNNNN